MTVLITGGAKGLGRSLAETLRASGYSVLVHYNKSLPEEIDGESIQGDFSTAASINDFILRLQSWDIGAVIHNVGNYSIVSGKNTSPSLWEALFFTNLYAVVAINNLLLPKIISEKGAIITIGATGLTAADSYSTAYTALKAALLSYTKSLAKELAPEKVSVNMVSPGVLPNSVDRNNWPILPQRAPVPFDEVAGVIEFLLRKENRSITGQNIEVAGGIRL